MVPLHDLVDRVGLRARLDFARHHLSDRLVAKPTSTCFSGVVGELTYDIPFRQNADYLLVAYDRQGGRMTMPALAALGITVFGSGSTLLSRNNRATNAIMGKMSSAKTNSVSISRWLLTPSRDSALKADTGAMATNVFANPLRLSGAV
jgi:hypothetical protein